MYGSRGGSGSRLAYTETKKCTIVIWSAMNTEPYQTRAERQLPTTTGRRANYLMSCQVNSV